MRKIYLFVFLFVTSIFASAQVALPYLYDFSGYFDQSGWSFQNNDDNCLMNNVLSGQMVGTNYGDNLWFISGFSDCGDGYRQYLISPRFVNVTADSVQFRFRCRIPDNQQTIETIVIGYCSADTYTDSDSFEWLPDTIRCTSSTDWISCVRNVPANAQYVAIAYTSGMQYALMIDDVIIRANTLNVLYPFTVNSTAGGIVTVTTGGITTTGSTSVAEADELTYTVTPNPGYYISSLYLDNVPNYYALNQPSFTQTLPPVLAAHVLDVTFLPIEYSIQIAAGEHGRIVPDGGDFHQLIVPWDTTIGFRFIPDLGYHVSSVALTSAGITTYYSSCPDTITLENIRNNYSLSVEFALNDYIVTATAGVGGTIVPSGEVNVQAFASQQFVITANPGYAIDSVCIDSVNIELPHNTEFVYVFDEVVDNHTITASFLHQSYLVTWSHTPHGTITAMGGVQVGIDSIQLYYEDTVMFHFSAEEGYELADIQFNGISVGNDNPYLLTHVTGQSQLHAVFAEQQFQVTAQAHGSGTVSPHQSAATSYFDTVRFVVAPGNCMQISAILLDGDTIDISDTVCLTHLAGSHSLDVHFAPLYYTLDIQPCTHGTIIGNPEVVCGGIACLQLVPDHCCALAQFLLDGQDRSDLLRNINDTLCAYIPTVTAPYTVAAVFERRQFQVTVIADGAGSITPGSVGTVACDTTLAFEVVPDECHYVASITINGADAESQVQHFPCADSGFGDTLRFTLANIESNQEIAVTFRQFEFPLTLSAAEHGSLSATGVLPLQCGTDTTITIIPDACYVIATVRADGTDVTDQLQYEGASATYTFSNVREPHTLEATFEQLYDTVSVAAGANGTVVPTQDTVIACGNDLSFVIIPDECYQIDTAWLDGVDITGQLTLHANANYRTGDSAFYSLGGITANHTLRYSFRPFVYTLSATAFGAGSVTTDVTGGTVACGTSVSVTMVPDDCHQIVSVRHNGQEVTGYQVDENGVGTYTISEADGDIYLSVFFERKTFSLDLARPTVHGTIEYQPSMRSCGDTVLLTFRADGCYHLDSVMVDDLWIPVFALNEETDFFTYEIRDLRKDMLLDAAFSIDSFRYVSTDGVPLSVTDSVLACGQSLTVYALREDCQQLDSVRLNGVVSAYPEIDGDFLSVSGDTLFVHISDIQGDCDLAVFYSQMLYEVRTQVVGHGSISGPALRKVGCGDDLSLVVTAGACQHIDSITVQGALCPMVNDSLVVINDVHSDLDVVAYFGQTYYEVVAQSNAYGFVIGDTGRVACGANLAISFQPQDCAMLDSVFMDGVCVNDQLDYQVLPTLIVDSVCANYTIVALFKPTPYQVELRTEDFSYVDQQPFTILDCGDTYILNIATDSCHYIRRLLLDGVSVLPAVTPELRNYHYEIPDVRRNFTVELKVDRNVYSVATTFVDELGHVLASSGSHIDCGSDTTLYASYVDDCYAVDSVYINGERVTLEDSYYFDAVSANIGMTVYMHRMEYTVEVLEHAHCTISDGVESWIRACGESVNIAFEPEDGYVITALVVDGDTLPASEHFSFTDLHADHTISVLTEQLQYTVTTTVNGFGRAVPDSVMLPYGGTATVVFYPEYCHEVSYLVMDGSATAVADSVVVGPVMENHHIEVGFAKIEYVVNVQVEGNGHVSVPGSNLLACGEDFSFEIYPGDCHYVENVMVDGVSVMDSLLIYDDYATLTMSAVSANREVVIQVGQIEYTCTAENGSGGVVNMSDSRVACGGTWELTIEPSSCYHLESLVVSGNIIPVEQLAVQGDQLIFVAEDVRKDLTAEVRFEKDTFAVAVLNGGEGTVLLSADSVICGGEVSFCVIPAQCSRLSAVMLNGDDIIPRLTYRDNANPWLSDTACYTITGIDSDQQIEVLYETEEPRHIDVAFISGTNVLARTDLSVACGSDTVVTLTLDCYTMDSVLVDGIRVETSDTYHFNEVISDHTLQAFFGRNQYQITALPAEHGSIQPVGIVNVTCGGNQTYTIAPAQGYYVENLIVDGDTIAASATYTFVDVRMEHTLAAVFATFTYAIDVEAGAGGSVSPGDTILPYGSSIHYDIIPDECYSVDSVVVNGQNRGAVASFDFENITGPQTLAAYFSLNTYSVTSEVVGAGFVTLGADTVDCGGSVSLSVSPADCFVLDSVVFNGTNIGAVTSYEIDNIVENQYVIAYFSQIVYNVVVDDAMVNGNVLLTSHSVPCGENVALTVVPELCYSVDSVIVNGINLGAVTVYTLQNVREDQTISAYFSIDDYEVEVIAGDHGTVTSVGTNWVTCGDNFPITITPDDCYEIGYVSVDGQWANYLLQGNTLTLPDIASDRQISVSFDMSRYYQRATCNLGGTVSPGFVAPLCGSDQTFEIDPLNCYRIDTIWINGNVYPNDSLTYDGNRAFLTLHDIRQDNNIVVRFAGILYQFEVENNGGGSVFLEQHSVDCDGEVTFSILPSQCERVQSVILNDIDITQDIQYHANINPLMPDTAYYTIARMDEDQFLQINYQQLSANNISIAYMNGTSIVHQADSLIDCAQTVNLPISYDCYTVDSVVLDGNNVGAVSSLSVSSNLTDRLVTVFLSRNQYEVTAVSNEGGSILFDNGTSAYCGDTLRCSIAPADCYQIDSVVVNGENQGAIAAFVFENITEDQSINAYFSREVRTVTATSMDGGTIIPQGVTNVLCGDSFSYSITPDACYSIDSVIVNGSNVGAVSSFVFENIVENQEITAYFSRNLYTVTASAEMGGQIVPSGIVAIPCGDSQTFAIVPDDCYQIDSVIVNGINVGAVSSYQLVSSEEVGNQMVTAYFSQRMYPVAITSVSGGQVIPAGDTLIACGESLTIEILPDECYSIETLIVDGNEIEPAVSYTFENVREAHTFAATFAVNAYVLTPIVNGGGTVSPNISTTVDCGEDFTFYFMPNNGHYVSAIVVDGDTLEAADSYMFTDVNGNHQIEAVFSLLQYEIVAVASVGGSATPQYSLVDYMGHQTITISANDCYNVDSVFVDGNYVGNYTTYTFNNVSGDHTLTATFRPDEYEITASVVGNGTITPAGTTTVACGDNATFTFAPETGWHLTGLLVDGEPVDATDSYTFTDVREDHAITAQFAIDEFTVTATAGDGGLVTPTDTAVTYGSSVTVGITAADCYRIDSVFADGTYVGAVTSYTFENVADDHTLTATFVRNEYEIMASVEGSGTITPAGATTVACGDNATFTFAPETGWHFTGLLVDGELVEAADSYTFTDVREGHAITAQFAIDEFTVTATVGDGGSVTPTDTAVTYGSSVNVEITAADCYRIDSVFADGTYVGAVTSYTFENVADHHTLTATFRPDEYEITASVEGSGTITPAGTTTVSCGENATFTFAPETGWHFTGLLVDGEPVEAADSYTFTDVREGHTITAQFAIDEFTVTATAGDGGSVTPTDTTVTYGSSVTVEITTDDCYHIDYVTVNGINIGAVTVVDIFDIAENKEVDAFFAPNVYEVTVSVVNEDEFLFFDTLSNVMCGSDTLVSVPLFDCYYVDSILVNGNRVEGVDFVQLEDIRTDVEVIYYLSREQFVVIASQQGSGEVSPLGEITVFCDDQQEFVFTPDEGWYVQNLIVDGESLGTPAENSYTFVNIHDNHSIEVVFAQHVYIITSSIDPIDAGQISPYGDAFVNYGEDLEVVITPFPGYEVVDVVVDGVSQGSLTSYTFHHVDANHTIVAHLITVGVDENTVTEEIFVWPNPVESSCHVRIPEMNGNAVESQLFDAQGKLLQRERFEGDEIEMDFSGRPSGMYLLRIVSDGKVVTTRKVIRK